MVQGNIKSQKVIPYEPFVPWIDCGMIKTVLICTKMYEMA